MKENEFGHSKELKTALDQLNQLMKVIDKKEKLPTLEELPEGVEEQIAALEGEVNRLRTEVDRSLAEQQVEETSLHAIIESIPPWLPKEHQEQLRLLQQHKETLEGKLLSSPSEKRGKGSAKPKGSPAEKGAARKNKFKQMGGDSWKKM